MTLYVYPTSLVAGKQKAARLTYALFQIDYISKPDFYRLAAVCRGRLKIISYMYLATS